MSNTEYLLRAGLVQRYHAQPEIPCQSVAEHSWGVALLVILFYGSSDGELLQAAITHDMAERVTGDIPSPMKKKFPELKTFLDDAEHSMMCKWDLVTLLSDKQKLKLKICDILEGLSYTAVNVRRTGEGYHTLESWLDYLVAFKEHLTQDQLEFIEQSVAGLSVSTVRLEPVDDIL